MLWAPGGGWDGIEGLLPTPQCLPGAVPPPSTQLSETPQDCTVWGVVLQVMPWLPSALSLGPLICISNESPPPPHTHPHQTLHLEGMKRKGKCARGQVESAAQGSEPTITKTDPCTWLHVPGEGRWIHMLEEWETSVFY